MARIQTWEAGEERLREELSENEAKSWSGDGIVESDGKERSFWDQPVGDKGG